MTTAAKTTRAKATCGYCGFETDGGAYCGPTCETLAKPRKCGHDNPRLHSKCTWCVNALHNAWVAENAA